MMAGGAIGAVGGGAGPIGGPGLGAGGRGLSAMGVTPHSHTKALQPTPRVRSVDDLAILYLLLASQQNQQSNTNNLISLAVQPASASKGTNVDLMV